MDENEVMSGKFYCGTNKLTNIIAIVWFAETSVTCAFWGLKAFRAEILLLFIALAIAGADSVRYYADEDGVEFRRGVFRKYLSYDDIENVTIVSRPCGHTRYGGTEYENVLTIKTAEKEIVYREHCGTIYAEDLIERPADVEIQLHENELSWLAEHIQAKVNSD